VRKEKKKKAWILPWLCFSLFFWDLIPNITRGEHLVLSISIIVSTLYILPEVYKKAVRLLYRLMP
jgi:hypothetical protein